MSRSDRSTPTSHKPQLAWFVMLLLLLPCVAWAQTAPDGPLPYEAGLSNLMRSLTGPVPFAISLVGIVACGAMLIFGGEISGFMRTLVFLVLVIAVIVQAGSIVKMLGGNWQGTPGEGMGALLSPAAVHIG